MPDPIDRREVLQLTGAALLGHGFAFGEEPAEAERRGCVVGQPEAAHAGMEVLAEGGNAVDAAVASALVAAVVAVHQCGVGGYGGHLVIASSDGAKVTAIDYNGTAPAAAKPDMFPLDDKGQVKDRSNVHGWRAAGVPGLLAGMQLALDRYGTRPFAKLVQPAIRYAQEGFSVGTELAKAIRTARAQIAKDPAAARLLLPKGEPPEPRDTFKNPELAKLLQTLAEQKGVDSFYHGDIAAQIAAAFKRNGGLVTADDLAAYRAREVEPLRLEWRGYTICTAPLTAGGLTVLEALAVLKSLRSDRQPAGELGEPASIHARLEALRLAWHDRLTLLGDPEKVEVPVARLLSEEHADRLARQVRQAVHDKKPIPAATDGRPADGTIHLSAVDSKGMMVALTLTHGGAFGAQVAVDGLGLVLGHGMSRFDPRPNHPNCPGPGKRQLHNMCPTVVLRDGRPVLALGGRGGRRIPNAIVEVLAHYVGHDASMEDAVAAARMHTEGGLKLTLETKWRDTDVDHLRQLGYTIERGPSAVVSAVTRDPKSGTCRAMTR